jgi:hypothetical protein
MARSRSRKRGAADRRRDGGKPPPTSYRETYRRHRKLLSLPVILGALAAAVFLFAFSKSYKSTANLWIDTTPPTPSSVGGAGATAAQSLAQPPATAEQGVLTELLGTASFDASVAQGSLLGKSLGSTESIRAKAPGLLGSGQVVPTVTGAQVLQITYTGASPAMAESVLGSVIAQLRNYSGRLIAQHADSAIAYDREQVRIAETALAVARGNANAYREQHPGVTQADPNYLSLATADNNAVTQLGQANAALSQATGASNAGGWSIQVIDPPSQATAAALKKTKMIEVILAGALGGLLVSFLAVVAMTPAKKEAWEDELPLDKPFISDVPPADPFPAESSAVATEFDQPTAAPVSTGRPLVSAGDRRFRFWSGSAPSEDP